MTILDMPAQKWDTGSRSSNANQCARCRTFLDLPPVDMQFRFNPPGTQLG